MSIRYNHQVDAVRMLISELLEKIIGASQLTLDAFEENDIDKLMQVQNDLGNVAVEGDIIDNEIIKTFALYGPEANELRTLVAYLKMNNEIISIGGGVKKYARRMKEHLSSECNLAPLHNTIIQLHKSTINALSYIYKCFKNLHECNIDDYYRKVMIEESKNDDLYTILEKEIMNTIIDEKELTIEYVRILATLRRLERSCDRSVNIANLMMYAKKGGNLNLYS